MSQLASQPGLVANQALSLSGGPPVGFTPEQRDRARLIIDTARTQSMIARQTPGPVGQQGARTGQLLEPPPVAQPVRSRPLQEALGQLEARMSGPTMLEQFFRSGRRVSGPGELDQLRRRSQLEFESRSSPAGIIARARLKQQILAQQQSDARAAQSFGFRQREEERSEVRLQLSLARQAGVEARAEKGFRSDLAAELVDQMRSLDLTREDLSDFATQIPPLGAFQGDQRIVMSRVADAIRDDPELLDRLKIGLAGKLKRTLTERREAEQAALSRRVLSMALNPKVSADDLLDASVESLSLSFQIQRTLDKFRPEVGQQFSDARLKLSTTTTGGTPGAGGSVDEQALELLRQ